MITGSPLMNSEDLGHLRSKYPRRFHCLREVKRLVLFLKAILSPLKS